MHVRWNPKRVFMKGKENERGSTATMMKRTTEIGMTAGKRRRTMRRLIATRR